jgi:hypothetical protein
MNSSSYFKSPVIKLEPRDGVRAVEVRLPPGVDRIYLLSSNADISKINISVDGGDLIPLADFLPAEILPPPERITLYWEPTEDGKEIQFLLGREYYRRATQAVVVMRDYDTKPIIEDIRNRLPSSLSELGNFRVSIDEALIKLPIDIQDHWVESVVLLASGTRTASGVGADVDVGRFIMGEVLLDVTDVSGTTPTLNVYLEGKNQYTNKYKVIWAVENVSSVGEHWLTITNLAFRYLRVRWEIGGISPSFTFSVSMEGKS